MDEFLLTIELHKQGVYNNMKENSKSNASKEIILWKSKNDLRNSQAWERGGYGHIFMVRHRKKYIHHIKHTTMKVKVDNSLKHSKRESGVDTGKYSKEGNKTLQMYTGRKE